MRSKADREFLLAFFLGALSVVLDFASGISSNIVEENRPHQLTCRFSQTEKLEWQRKEGSTWVTLSKCEHGSGCTENMRQAYTSKMVASKNGDGFESQLTIVDVNRNYTTYKCARDGREFVSFQLEVYVKSVKPMCRGPLLVISGRDTHLKVDCWTEKIYPQGRCELAVNKGLSAKMNSTTYVSSNSTKSTTSPGDYSAHCTLHIPLMGMNPGVYQLEVETTIYPQLSTYVEASSVYNTLEAPVTLSLPEVTLASDCPKGSVQYDHIMTQTTASCRCELASQGFPPGRAQWFLPLGGPLDSAMGENGSATMTFKAEEGSPDFHCQAESILNNTQPNQVAFKPKVAYGPTEIFLVLDEKPFDLCPSESFKKKFICRVPGMFVNPAPRIRMEINDLVAINAATGHHIAIHDQFEVSYSFRPRSGGMHRFYCKAMNSAFGYLLFTEDEKQFEVRAPPSKAPELRTSDNQPFDGIDTAYISNRNTVVDIICEVEGGYPAVSNVTIFCGINTNVQQGNRATIGVRIPESTDTLRCSCVAWHVTKCYDLRTDIILKVGQADPDANVTTLKSGKDSDDDNSTLATGLGVGLGITLTIAIIIIVVSVVIIFRVKKMTSKSFGTRGHNNTNYSRPEPPSPPCNNSYFSLRPTGVPPYPAPSIPDQGLYQSLEDDETLGDDSQKSKTVKPESGIEMDSHDYIDPIPDPPLYEKQETDVKQTCA